jgi:hypothetical protein
VLVIVLIVAGLIVLACAGLCGGCLYLTRQAVHEAGAEIGALIELSTVHEQARAAVVNDPAVKEKLGDPVEADELVEREGGGELKRGGETFHFEARGASDTTAQVTCTAMDDDGVWRLTVITVQCSDGTTINVTPPPPGGPELQFDMPDVAPATEAK